MRSISNYVCCDIMSHLGPKRGLRTTNVAIWWPVLKKRWPVAKRIFIKINFVIVSLSTANQSNSLQRFIKSTYCLRDGVVGYLIPQHVRSWVRKLHTGVLYQPSRRVCTELVPRCKPKWKRSKLLLTLTGNCNYFDYFSPKVQGLKLKVNFFKLKC